MSSIYEHFEDLNSTFYNSEIHDYEFEFPRYLISYDPLKKFTVIRKHISSFAWFNEIIKFFRNLFYPETRISTVLEGLSVEAMKITTTHERLFYIRFINLFKKRVVDQHNEFAGGLRSIIDTQKLEGVVNQLIETILQTESPSPLRDNMKQFILTGEIEISYNNFIDLYQASLRCLMPTLTTELARTLRSLYPKEYSIDTLRWVHKLYKILYKIGGMQEELQSWLKSLACHQFASQCVSKQMIFKEILQIARDCGSAELEKYCTDRFLDAKKVRIRSDPNFPKELEDRTKRYVREDADSQHTALITPPKHFDLALEEAVSLDLQDAALDIYSFVVKFTATLCIKAPYEALEERVQAQPEVTQGYINIVQKYASSLANSAKFPAIAALFEGKLFSPAKGQSLFKYLFSLYIDVKVDSENYAFHSSRVNRNNTDSRITQDCDLNVAQIISLYQDAIKLVDQLGLDWLKYFLLACVSYTVVFHKVGKELPAFSQGDKIELIDLVRKQFYPIIAPRTRYGVNVAKEVVAFEQTLTHYFADPGAQFNDPVTSDIKLKLSDGTILHLHKKVLSRSPYFRSMIADGFKESKQVEFVLLEENNDNNDILIDLLKYLYQNELEITNLNVLGVFSLAQKYHIEPFLPLMARIHLWMKHWVWEVSQSKEGDSIDLETLNSLNEIAMMLNEKYLIKDFYSNIFLSMNQYVISKKNITSEQFEDRKIFLKQHGHLLESYDGIFAPSLASFVNEWLPNLERIKWTYDQIPECSLETYVDAIISLKDKIILKITWQQLKELETKSPAVYAKLKVLSFDTQSY